MTRQLKNVAGGATGRIGDPSGRNSERSLLPSETIAHNLTGLQQASIFIVRASKLSKFSPVKNDRISFKYDRFYTALRIRILLTPGSGMGKN
jgi:tyrosyl-tRNA synthetase